MCPGRGILRWVQDMSLLQRQLKYNKKSTIRRGFKFITGERKAEAMGLSRVIATSIVLIFAATACYTTILYMLPFASPKQILGISQQNYAAAALEDSRSSWLKNTFLRPFELRRTFLGTHQGIRAHYVVPDGTVVDLRIEHCMRAIIVEAFKCKVVGSSTAEIPAGMGTRQFTFNRVGFYQFQDQLRYVDTGRIVPKSEQEGYRIIWVREYA